MPDLSQHAKHEDSRFETQSVAFWRGAGEQDSFSDELRRAVSAETWEDVLEIFSRRGGPSVSATGRIRVLALGDVHGAKPDDIEMDLQRVGFLNQEGARVHGDARTFVQMGDTVDRGRYSSQAYDYLVDLKKRYPSDVVLLLGNHDLYHLAGVPERISATPIQGLQEKLVRDVLDGTIVMAWAEGTTGTNMDTIYSHAGISLSAFPKFRGMPNQQIVAELNNRLVSAVTKLKRDLAVAAHEHDRIEAGSRFLERDRIFDSRSGVVWVRGPIENDQFRQVVGHTPQKDGIKSAPGLRVKYIDAGRIFGELERLNGDQARVLMENSTASIGQRYLASHPEVHRQFIEKRKGKL